MRRCLTGLLLALAIGSTSGGAASGLALTIRDGRVWLAANDVPVTLILAEWGRVGQIRLVNGERLPGGPVSLQLDGVPEDQALKVLLRSAAGFIAVPRREVVADASPTLSRFESILILAAAAAPAETRLRPALAPPIEVPPLPAAAAIAIGSGVQRRIGADGQPVPDDQPDTSGGAPIRQPTPRFTPPGFDEPPRVPPASQPAAPATPASTPGMAPGVAVPGMVVAPPVAQPGPPR